MIKNKKIIIVLVIVLLITIGIFVRRDNYYYDADISSFFVRENTELKDSVSIQDGMLIVNSVGEAEGLDFENIHTNIIEQPVPNMPFGVYDFKVKYRTDYANVSSTPSVSMGLIAAGRDIREDSIALCERVYLEDYKTEVQVPVYVCFVDKTQDLKLVIFCSAPGDTCVESIEITENQIWKTAVIAGEILLALGLLGLLSAIQKMELKQIVKFFAGVALVLVASMLAFNGPMGSVGGDDMAFHINRIGCLAHDIRSGNLLPLYQGDLGYGTGYIASTMYSNLFLYPAAFLHILGLPLFACYNFNIILVNIVTYLICMYSFKGLFGRSRYALFGTALYMLSLYRLVDCYYRAALGEFTAMAFLPLVVYGIYHIYYQVDKATLMDVMPLVLGVSGVLESHILSTEMMSIFLLLFALCNFKDTIKKIVPLMMAAVLCFLMNAFFLMPFLDAYRQPLAINSSSVSPTLMHTGNTLSQIMGLFVANRRTLGYNPTCLGLAFIIVVCAYIMLCLIQKNEMSECENTLAKNLKGVREKYDTRRATQCFIFGLLALWMASVYCPWNLLAGKSNIVCKLLMSIQFNYRYFEFAFLFLSIVGAYLYKCGDESFINFEAENADSENTSEKINVITKIVVILMAILVLGAGDFYSKIIPEAEYKTTYSTVTNLKTDELYCNVNFDAFARDPQIYLSDEALGSVNKAGTTPKGNKLFNVKLSSAADVILPIAYYNNLKVNDFSSGEEIASDCSADGKMVVHFPKDYDSTVVVNYEIKWGYYAARCISLLVAIALIGYYLQWKKR